MKVLLDRVVLKIYKLIFGEEPTAAVNAFVKNLTFVGMGFGVSAVLGLATQIIAGRILGPSEYGKYALIQSVSAFLSLPMVIGVSTALIKHSAEKDNFEDQKKIISTSYTLFLTFSLVSLIIFFIFSYPLSKFFGLSSDLFIYSIIFSFLFSAYLMAISVAQGLKKMKILSILQAIYGISGILAFFIFISFRVYTFRAIFFASSINYLVIFVLSIVIFHKYFCFNLDDILVKKIMRYSFYAFIFSLSSVIYLNFDRIMINKFFGSFQVGIYGAYYLAFISSVGYIFNTFNLVFFPMISGIHDKEIVFKKINRVALRLFIYIFIFVLLMGIVILKLYGRKYQFNIWLCLLSDVASVLFLLNSMYVWCMNAVGEKGARIASIAGIITAVINISANIFLVPRVGFFGAVISAILSYIASIIFIILNKNYYKPNKILEIRN